ncbi:radical SAM/SPASM domain-containing protein [Maridesulfovibrio sp.]|uniref:radical SAM protein n=1 Tax=unclassified Maridesulfovibrio TaxID=2794999 RepID=UPI003B007DDE
MYVKRKSTVLFRDYKKFGYVTDNRNYGYNKASEKSGCVGDRILSESGAVFFSVLDREAQSLDSIVRKICNVFVDVNADDIYKDAKDFYSSLEFEGFVVCGGDSQECEDKDVGFSYEKLNNESKEMHLFRNSLSSESSTESFLENYFEGEPQLMSLHIEIISKCNERCLHCYIPHEHKTNFIDSDLFYSVVRQGRDMNVLNLTLSGGEPLLHKDFNLFLKICREYEFSVNVLSNLTLLDEDIIEEMKLNPLLSVQTSLYSMDPNVHDNITQVNGSFAKTKKSILNLVKNNIPLQISCPIIKQNKSSYTDVLDWAESNNIHGGDYYGILGMSNNATSNLKCRMSIDEVEDVIKNKSNLDFRYFEQLENEVENNKDIALDDFVCSVCGSSLCVTDNGDVYPCIGWHNNVVGNLKEHPLKKIWENSDKIRALRKVRIRDFPKCVKCEDRDFCTICMVRNANESPTADPFESSSYFCSIAKLNKKLMREWKSQRAK